MTQVKKIGTKIQSIIDYYTRTQQSKCNRYERSGPARALPVPTSTPRNTERRGFDGDAGVISRKTEWGEREEYEGKRCCCPRSGVLSVSEDPPFLLDIFNLLFSGYLSIRKFSGDRIINWNSFLSGFGNSEFLPLFSFGIQWNWKIWLKMPFDFISSSDE